MAAEWKDIWTVASEVVARQPPPIQIFFWLCVAFALLMFVEGLRASFLPRRPARDANPHRTEGAAEPLSPTISGNPEPVFVRANRSNMMKYRKVVDATPRRHHAVRPKIRRMSSSLRGVQIMMPGESERINRRRSARFRLPKSESENVP
jgi:hypothetical protein